MTLRILPGDKDIFHRRYTDKFNSWYGEGIDAKQIYMNCGNNFVKFHAVFPDQAWLVERLCRIYKNIDVSLDAFRAKFAEQDNEETESTPTILLSTKYKDNDPFAYFLDTELDILHRRIYVDFISAIKTHKEDLTGNLFRELARSLLQIASEQQRQALLDELTSQETYDTLSAVHVGASTNIFTVRAAIMMREDMFAMDIARIREALAESQRHANDSSSVGDSATPESSAASSQPALAPVIQSGEAGGSGSGSYTVARSPEGLQWTVRRS